MLASAKGRLVTLTWDLAQSIKQLGELSSKRNTRTVSLAARAFCPRASAPPPPQTSSGQHARCRPPAGLEMQALLLLAAAFLPCVAAQGPQLDGQHAPGTLLPAVVNTPHPRINISMDGAPLAVSHCFQQLTLAPYLWQPVRSHNYPVRGLELASSSVHAAPWREHLHRLCGPFRAARSCSCSCSCLQCPVQSLDAASVRCHLYHLQPGPSPQSLFSGVSSQQQE